MRGLHPNRTRGRKARREGGGNQDNPRDEHRPQRRRHPRPRTRRDHRTRQPRATHRAAGEVLFIPAPSNWSEGTIRRITLSAPLFRLVTYAIVRASPKEGALSRSASKYCPHSFRYYLDFRASHPNAAVTRSGTIWRIAVSSACGLNSHVRISTLPRRNPR